MTPSQKPILSYDTEQNVRSALFFASVHDGMQTPDRVEKTLIAELRRRKRRVLAVQFVSVAALAAALLIGLFLVRPATSVPAQPISVTAVELERLAPQPAPVEPVVAKAVLRRRRVSKPPIQQQIAAVEPNEFIPIGPWQAMEPMERGSIIRIRLPKSSLPGFGIPVSADRWNESVPADVVLGEDGSMRAVRFVSMKQ